MNAVESIHLHKADELQHVIKESLEKTGFSKETDLCHYLAQNGKKLTPSDYLEMKERQAEELTNLLKSNIVGSKGALESPISVDSIPLEDMIQEAMERTDVERETLLCRYISLDGKPLHHVTYLRLKKQNSKRLKYLIKQNILDKNPEKVKNDFEKIRMASPKGTKKLLETISLAMKKLGAEIESEEEICRYLPHKESFMHPMAYRSLKLKNPEKLIKLLNQHVLIPENPRRLAWKTSITDVKRPAKEKGAILPEWQPKQTLEGANLDSLTEAIKQLSAKLDKGEDCCSVQEAIQPPIHEYGRSLHKNVLYTIKNQLIASIQRGEIDHELWGCYASL